MTTQTITATTIHMSKMCEFIHVGPSSLAYLAKCNTSDLAEHMDALCGDTVRIKFNTDARYEKKDIVKFTRRLDSVAGWTFSEWIHPVIEGHAQSFMECTATRCEGVPSRNDAAIVVQIEQKRYQIARLESSSGTGHDISKMIRLREELLALQCRLSVNCGTFEEAV